MALIPEVPMGGDEPEPMDVDDVKRDDLLDDELKEEATFRIEVRDFSLQPHKFFVKGRAVDGANWRLLCFPQGNNQKTANLSLYLDLSDSGLTQPGWARYALFKLTVISHASPEFNVSKDTNHRFCADAPDWGFSNFLALSELHNPSKRYIVDNTLTVEVHLRVVKGSGGMWGNASTWDSKKETGFVGLKNQGATCYMNSLLQTLYFTNAFRRAVYNMPADKDVAADSVPLALQRVFYELQTSNTAVGTTQLTKTEVKLCSRGLRLTPRAQSFGWDSVDSFMQHDVQEFSRVLIDNVEGKMKLQSGQDRVISSLFEGRMKSFVRCVNVNYESTRSECFYDVQLNVKGMRGVAESFKDYVQVERLDGDNKYMAEGYGLQEADKGVIFESFPPVLHLQLKRFEYDMQTGAMVKINDRYEFPECLELDAFLDKPEDTPARYLLHAVLVHSGDVHGGHYVVYIKPRPGGEWFRFDDDRVTRARVAEALDGNFGSDDKEDKKGAGGRMSALMSTSGAGRGLLGRLGRRFTNAYMLVYIRESRVAEVLAELGDADVPAPLRERLERERTAEEARRRELLEQHLYTTVKVATAEDFAQHSEFDLVSFEHPAVRSVRIRREAKVSDLRRAVAAELGVAEAGLRLWHCVRRQNKTLRPDAPLADAAAVATLVKDAPAKLFAEMPVVLPGGEVLPIPAIGDDDILIFVKFYSPERAEMRYAGHLFTSTQRRIGEVLPLVRRLVGLPADTPLVGYEEIKPEMIEPLDPARTFAAGELQSGDILCFQLRDRVLGHPEPALPTVPSYFAHLANRIRVQFRSCEQPRDEAFALELGKRMLYDEVAERVGRHLNHDPQKLRFSPHNSLTDAPRAPLKRAANMTLLDMLTVTGGFPAPNVLYYEQLPVPLAEYETKRVLRVSFFNARVEEERELSLMVPRTGTVGDVIAMALAELRAPTAPSRPAALGGGAYRLMEVSQGRIARVLPETEPVERLQQTIMYMLRLEESAWGCCIALCGVPEEERTRGEGDRVVEVRHFHRDHIRSHGHPFLMVLGETETLGSIKSRIRARLGVPEKEFEKYRCAIVQYGKPKYLEDDECVVLRDPDFAHDSAYFGLDHPDKAGAVKQRSIFERPVIIKN